MGLSQPGFSAGQYRFMPAASGLVNRHPSEITADGQVYCYEPRVPARRRDPAAARGRNDVAGGRARPRGRLRVAATVDVQRERVVRL